VLLALVQLSSHHRHATDLRRAIGHRAPLGYSGRGIMVPPSNIPPPPPESSPRERLDALRRKAEQAADPQVPTDLPFAPLRRHRHRHRLGRALRRLVQHQAPAQHDQLRGPDDRHFGHHLKILSARRRVHAAARSLHPERWTSKTRNWNPIRVVCLNPEYDNASSKFKAKHA
jgi:hypothetical protein